MIRLIAFLLIAGSLSVGLVCASTAYVPYVQDIKEATPGEVEVVHLNDDIPVNDELTWPAGTALTPTIVTQLMDAKIERVPVKEFSLARWREKLWFGLCIIGLIAGGMLMRMAGRGNAALELGTSLDRMPTDALAEAREAIREVLEKQAMLSDDEARGHHIVHRLDEIQRGPLNDFVEARSFLLGAHGMSGYAQIMDRFARAERQINRAWSAAADGVILESQTCLANGLDALDETIAHFKQL